MQPQVFPIVPLEDYELLDSGGGEKLERWGERMLRRPDPQALWRPKLPEARWQAADGAFVRESDRGGRWVDGRGRVLNKDLRWACRLLGGRFWIQPTPFKHVGAFPEQATNWRCVADLAPRLGAQPAAGSVGGPVEGAPRLLNLFGYTGVASVLAAQAGYAVTHVDASRTALQWVGENARASGLDERAIRWVLDDALAFAQREVRRESRYQVVLLDPPHYGRGPKGQKWRLEEGLAPLLEAARDLLADSGLLILSTYAVGYSPLAFANLLDEFGDGRVEAGELALREVDGGRTLPAGFCARFWKGGAGVVSEPRVLLADNHVLALAKPAGLPCVPDDSGDASLLDWGKHWVGQTYQKPGAVFLGVVHRLDRPVSGVVVFGRTSKGAGRLSESLSHPTDD